ncbi:MAG: chemotaxis response regulator protein-glutamate methylesterase [Spirochaetales bacterium]|nr:chemotaxis response regulator protein-glutamate methylesterase [Spirochaetales bacterium]
MEKIKVMVVDDSALVRQSCEKIFQDDSEIEIIATAQDPFIAASKMMKEAPDVVILDLEMPRMDGLTFLKKIMSQHPLPVIICSSKAEEGSGNAIEALELGAVDIIRKPHIGTKSFIQEEVLQIKDIIKAAYISKQGKIKPSSPIMTTVSPKLSADAVLARPRKRVLETTERIVAIGASTGGTEAIREILEAMPLDAPGIVIVQHMPEYFTKAFAKRLDSLCRISVKEAEENDPILPGHALIAPGNRHTLVRRRGARYSVELSDGPLVKRHRPSVDVLFRSAAEAAGKNAMGVILTGMGDDGAEGLLELKEMEAHTIAQDKASSIVFGMPNEAIKLGAANKILSLNQIPTAIIAAYKQGW